MARRPRPGRNRALQNPPVNLEILRAASADTIKNVVNIVARENTGLCTEELCQVLAKKYLVRWKTPAKSSAARQSHSGE